MLLLNFLLALLISLTLSAQEPSPGGRTVTEATRKLEQSVTNLQNSLKDVLEPIYDLIKFAPTAAGKFDRIRQYNRIPNSIQNLTTDLRKINFELEGEYSFNTGSGLSDEVKLEDLKMALKKSIAAIKSNNVCAGVDGSADSKKDLKQSFRHVRHTLEAAFSTMSNDTLMYDFFHHAPESMDNWKKQFAEIIIVLRENGYELDEPESNQDLSTKNPTEDRRETWKQALMDVPKAIDNLCVENKTDTDTGTDIGDDYRSNKRRRKRQHKRHQLEFPGLIAAFGFNQPKRKNSNSGTKRTLKNTIEITLLFSQINQTAGRINGINGTFLDILPGNFLHSREITPGPFWDDITLNTNYYGYDVPDWKANETTSEILAKATRDFFKRKFKRVVNMEKKDGLLSYGEFVKLTKGAPIKHGSRRKLFDEIKHLHKNDSLVSFKELEDAEIWVTEHLYPTRG